MKLLSTSLRMHENLFGGRFLLIEKKQIWGIQLGLPEMRII